MCPTGAKDEASTDATLKWYKRAQSACEPFMFAAARFRTPWVDDEFSDVIRAARQWLCDNSCPDDSLGQHFVAMLDAYGEMTNATVARVMDLRVVIEQELQSLELWNPPHTQSASPPDSNLHRGRSTGQLQSSRPA